MRFRTANPRDFGRGNERASQHAIILRCAPKNVVFARMTRSYGFYRYAPQTRELSAPFGESRLTPDTPFGGSPSVLKHPKTVAQAGGRAGTGFLLGVQKPAPAR
jgi:hypothetical protein